MGAGESDGRLGVVCGSSLAATALAAGWERRVVAVTGAQGAAVQVPVLVDDATAGCSSALVLDRHGLDHHVQAHRIDHAANVRALQALGCDRVVALGSTGSLRAGWPVGTVVATDDHFAPWSNPTLYEDHRAHVAPRVDPGWRREVLGAWRSATTTPIIDGATYVQTRGPRFESAAEVRFYGTVGDVVGMTMADESLLAVQAGIRWAGICIVDNLANGVEAAGSNVTPLTLEVFVEGVAANRERFGADVGRLVEHLRQVR